MKYVVEIFADGVLINTLKSNKGFQYDKCDKIVESYLNDNMPNRKELSSSTDCSDGYAVYFDKNTYKSLCIYLKRRAYIDIKDSEGNPIVIGKIYEGHEQGSNEIYRYTINCSGWYKDEYYIRNLSRYDKHYDWSSGKPREIPAISDKDFKIDDNIQSFIDKYELKPFKK